MSSFMNTPHPDHHHGADRTEALMDGAQQVPHNVSGKRGAALLLGSALLAAVAAASYEFMDSADESHLLMIWMVLWIALFSVLAFFARTLRAAGLRLRNSLDDWSRSLAEARADQHLWAIARLDERVMADLQSAMSRSETLDEVRADTALAGTQALAAAGATKQRSYSMQRAYL